MASPWKTLSPKNLTAVRADAADALRSVIVNLIDNAGGGLWKFRAYREIVYLRERP